MIVTEREVCLLARIPSFMSLSVAASSFTLGSSSSSSAISQLNGIFLFSSFSFFFLLLVYALTDQ